MQKVVVQIDWFTKTVLVLIAVLLVGILIRPSLVSNPASGYGEYLHKDPMPVYVANELAIPVDVANRVDIEIGNTVDVRIPDGVEITNTGRAPIPVDARITDSSLGLGDTLYVVTWKEREGYLRWDMKRQGLSEEAIESWMEKLGY